MSEDATVEGFRKLATPSVADVFRFAGYFQQVMDPTILPLIPGVKLCGRALTLANLPRRKNEPAVFDQAEAAMKPGDIVVESYFGAWGLNFAVGAQARGASGAVIDGPHRDIPAHRSTMADFPIFCRRGLAERSSNPGGSHRAFRTRWMYAYNVPINCGGVRVEAGDILLGDDDGVVVIPANIEKDVLNFAQQHEKAEHNVVADKRALKTDTEAHRHTRDFQKSSGIVEWGRAQNR